MLFPLLVFKVIVYYWNVFFSFFPGDIFANGSSDTYISASQIPTASLHDPGRGGRAAGGLRHVANRIEEMVLALAWGQLP